MKKTKPIRRIAPMWRGFLLAGAIGVAGCTAGIEQNPELAQRDIPFDISCDAATQSDFSDAVELLHSFEYVETTKRFDAQIAREPGCAMAYWGAAMSIWHPLWAPPNQEE